MRPGRSAAASAVLLPIALGIVGCASTPSGGLEPLPAIPSGWTHARDATTTVTTTAPDSGSAGDDRPAGRMPGPAGSWWLAVDDPQLHRLVEAAGDVASVRLARERLAEAEAALRAASAALAPSVNGSVSASFNAPGDGAVRQSTRSTAAVFGYDFDVSGAGRARESATRALVESRTEAVAAARIAAREMAVRLYAAFAGAAERRQATLLSVRSLEDALRLAAARTRAGLGTELDVAQARAALAAARAQLPRLEAARDSVRLGLEALLGHLPGTLAPTLARLEAAPTVDAMPLMRTPLQVVASRPDLRAAEHELAAASATTAAALRDRWPKLTLDVLIGVQSVRIAGPLAGDGLTSSLLAGLTGPLFDAGRLAARADAARARERAAAIAYRQAALEALGEVEDGLQRLAQAMAEDDQNAVAADAAAARVALARSRWRAGLVPFLDVVLAEQALHAANAERALSRSRMLESFARLSAAVGLGGEAGG
ncbi:MAG: TolC family protein [Rhodocyclaceae bacterium]|nr:TolC family protein [Rhodocyclaceae bacterium]MCA3073394.1 TolC family protein [Rhodocyclaceae bacterium]MCA3088576.1 TolC family protein [Rhodocyclaceae bacterium]MCA3092640.1 TolC family protein [Rhodocyclaceae bacterium]MCA3098573.1 TolC family protein [Rhodocyclaceae bacterium]